MISPRHNNGRIKTIALIALVCIIAFVGFTASAYVASKNTDTLHGTFDPAVNEFNNYLNFITGKQIQTSDDKPTVNTPGNQQPQTIKQSNEPKVRFIDEQGKLYEVIGHDYDGSPIVLYRGFRLVLSPYPTPSMCMEFPNYYKDNVFCKPDSPTKQSDLPVCMVGVEGKCRHDSDKISNLPVCANEVITGCRYDFDHYGYYYKDTIAKYLFDDINNERASRGLNILRYDGFAQAHAMWYAQYQASVHLYNHSDTGNNNGITVRQWQDIAGYTYKACGENQWVIQFSLDMSLKDIAQYIHNGFMNSKPHRENILYPNHNTMGIGIYILHNTSNDLVIYASNRSNEEPSETFTGFMHLGNYPYFVWITEELCERT